MHKCQQLHCQAASAVSFPATAACIASQDIAPAQIVLPNMLPLQRQQCPVPPQACPGADCTKESLMVPGLCAKHSLHFQHESPQRLRATYSPT